MRKRIIACMENIMSKKHATKIDTAIKGGSIALLDLTGKFVMPKSEKTQAKIMAIAESITKFVCEPSYYHIGDIVSYKAVIRYVSDNFDALVKKGGIKASVIPTYTDVKHALQYIDLHNGIKALTHADTPNNEALVDAQVRYILTRDGMEQLAIVSADTITIQEEEAHDAPIAETSSDDASDDASDAKEVYASFKLFFESLAKAEQEKIVSDLQSLIK